ncbi:Os03g0659601 [Oryza sativa Japonica Group]|uniref:Os03g0659601 protein n=1 Tax=Oryza sativa subsp. japonica TaxID=39947 RepID=A0A0P0W0Y3_ORYSJ|nr:Os03g0659601 [Oryza sativa Japonica Group]
MDNQDNYSAVLHPIALLTVTVKGCVSKKKENRKAVNPTQKEIPVLLPPIPRMVGAVGEATVQGMEKKKGQGSRGGGADHIRVAATSTRGSGGAPGLHVAVSRGPCDV